MPAEPHRNSHFWGGLETQVAGDELAIWYLVQYTPLLAFSSTSPKILKPAALGLALLRFADLAAP